MIDYKYRRRKHTALYSYLNNIIRSEGKAVQDEGFLADGHHCPFT